MVKVSQEIEKVASKIPHGGEVRAGQIDMAEQVAATIREQGSIFVEAGTGTGKTFAYLIPTILADQPAVISTATIALQNQLVGSDIPMVLEALGAKRKVALLKGRNNYICQQKINEIETDNNEQLHLIPAPDEPELEQIVEWASKTSTGDREELEELPKPAVWSAVSVTGEECPGVKACPAGESCFSEQARSNADQADIVVTNHHYYGLNLSAGGSLLPEHEIAIFDEAHQLPQVLEVTCGLEIGPRSVAALAARSRTTLTDEKISNTLQKLGERLESLLNPLVGGPVRIENELHGVLTQIRSKASELLIEFNKLEPRQGSEVAAKIARNMRFATHMIDDLDKFTSDALSSHDSPQTATRSNAIIWADKAGRSPTLKLTPLDFDDITHKRLWSDRSVVLTSATISDSVSEQLGSKKPIERIASPYDYESQGLLYCPTDLPNPNSPEYRSATHKRTIELIEAAGGRSLVLFTSYSALNEAAESLEAEFGPKVLVQGAQPKHLLLQQFQDTPDTILLATMSFWQGVDVPGESLTLVVIDRIPFPRPDDPVLQAKRKLAGPRAFGLVDLPIAQTLLAQASGRLIRRGDDSGVVAILDPRLANNRSYRWDLINALPPFRRTKSLSDATAMLEKLDKQHLMRL